MTDLLGAMAVAAQGMEAQSRRLRVISENIANADTPGFRRKLLTFDVDRDSGGVAIGDLRFDRAELPEIYDPAHPLANEQGVYQGSSVEVMMEIADAREAQRSYEANLRIIDQSRRMASAVTDLLKR